MFAVILTILDILLSAVFTSGFRVLKFYDFSQFYVKSEHIFKAIVVNEEGDKMRCISIKTKSRLFDGRMKI